jgi:hypothetical protein
MAAITYTIEKHHKSIILSLVLVIVIMVAACTFHDIIPVCHWVFGCDHRLHAVVYP